MGNETALSSQSGPFFSIRPLFQERKRTKINVAAIKQLSGNQIIARTGKPINKGATKANRTAELPAKVRKHKWTQGKQIPGLFGGGRTGLWKGPRPPTRTQCPALMHYATE